MDKSDPNVVARLVALNERTRKAWAHPHNQPFYIPASFQGFSVHDGRSREPTPCEEDMKGGDHIEDTEPELRLCFSNRPKDIRKVGCSAATKLRAISIVGNMTKRERTTSADRRSR